MTLTEQRAPALGVEARSDEAPSAGAIASPGSPDPEVVAKWQAQGNETSLRVRNLA